MVVTRRRGLGRLRRLHPRRHPRRRRSSRATLRLMLSVKAVKDCRELAWEHALTAEMNVGYYRTKVARAKRWDYWIKGISILTALSGFGVFVAKIKAGGLDLSPWLSLAAAVAMMLDLALQFPEKVRELGVLLSEYTAHEARFKKLYQFGCDDESVSAAIVLFHETVQREAKVDPDADEKLLNKMQARVLRRIESS